MSLAKQGQVATRAYYKPVTGAPIGVLAIYLGTQVVMDGRVHAFVNAPYGRAAGAGGGNALSAGSAVMVPAAGGGDGVGYPVDVVADSVVGAPSGSGVVADVVADVSADASVTPDGGSGSADGGPDADATSFYGVFAPSADVSADGGSTAVQADFSAMVPAGAASGEGGVTAARTDGFIAQSAGSGSADGGGNALSADAAVTAPAGAGSATGYAPAIAFDANVSAPNGTGSAAGGGVGVVAQGFSRQRMNKSGTYNSSSVTVATVTGWTSDATNPATVVSDSIVVAGGGTATITFHVVYTCSNAASSPAVYIYLNGSQIATKPQEFASFDTTLDCTWTGTVPPGATVEVRCNGFSTTIKAGSYLDINPN